MIVTADSVTKPGDAAGKVLVAGSHAGIVSAWFAAQTGARAVILHDAGVGKDGAGISGLEWLERFGMAGAAVSHTSARIGDGADVLASGVISHANALAQKLGVQAGMACKDAAVRLSQAATPSGPVPDYRSGARV